MEGIAIVTKWAMLLVYTVNGEPQMPVEYMYSTKVQCEAARDALVSPDKSLFEMKTDKATSGFAMAGVGLCFPVEGVEIGGTGL